MKKYMFTSEEIAQHKANSKDWHNFVRRKEAEITFSLFTGRRFGLALELGAGDGGQSVTISKHCDKLVCTEIDKNSYAWLGKSILQRKITNVEYELCDAQDLSRFSSGSFDLIFSSNMLEHIPDVDRCLNECRRVLKNDGIMLHTMPSRWWKAFNSGLNMLKLKRPAIHGISKSHWEELNTFGTRSWIKCIESNGLKVNEIIGLPFYVGHGNHFIPLIKTGNILRLPSSYLYFVQKNGMD